ncbi:MULTISPECIES: histidine phosphatase family protein [unclassified Methylobacterium]|jgi:broad specificity phosphatase PhoE|uniref:histidine phosphatase family protein n=1 Tax=unclassified Methylobacterium TaxID=2615210 RepID=UPI0013532A08|nr:histidine phosphatase family protein [Methylobacterium sp. 2A]MWV24604.1 histidine phosphatase family protein [Methylobacterium sp. 2A]
MRRVILVRHGSHDRLGRILCGRMPGVSLSATGRAEAQALARRLAGSGAGTLLASPRERTAETAAPIAAALGLTVATEPDLDEIAFGAWTGRTFDALADDPDWTAWNTARATARPPGGEGMAEAQERIVRVLDRFAQDGAPVILVSHGDVIRAALLKILGLGLDAYDRIVVDPASCSELALWPGGGRVVSLNERTAP